jgi:hypothetical protein
MNLYRIFPWNPDAAENEIGGALFAPKSASGRFDNPDLYQGLYCATSPEAAVGERFGFLARWRPSSFIEGTRRLSLATIDAPDELKLADLASLEVLEAFGVTRVTEVATRSRDATKRLAQRIFESGQYDGLTWWSVYLADWTNVLIWNRADLRLATTPEHLTVTHPAVTTAAALLPRSISRQQAGLV